ncbi:MAG: PAS domain S-box protein, partial [Magnetococcales bacterium]|nr:PAS domain S-box protein [Magnetococcales bacterium]
MPALVQLDPAAVPMQYNTALCFLLSGVGLLSIPMGWLRLAQGCGMAIGVLGILTGTQYILGVDFGLDQLFMHHYITVKVIHPGRMAPNTTLCFTLSGMGLVMASARKARWRTWEVVGLLGTVTATLGLVAVIGYLTDLESTYHWFQYTRIAGQTAIGFVSVGFGLISLAWYHTASRVGVIPKWLILALGLGGTVHTVVLWIAYDGLLEHGKEAFSGNLHAVSFLILGLGTCMTAAMMATVWMAHIAQERLRLLKVAHDNLREGEQNLSITLNSIGDGVIVTDRLGHVTRMNPVAEMLTGWPLPEAIRQPLLAVFPLINAMTRQPVVDPVTKVIRSGRVEGMANHTVLTARDGTERQIADSGAPILDPDGQVMGVVLVFRDVTEEYRIRQAIETSEQRLRAVVENMPVLLAAFDDHLIPLAWNRECAKVTGYTAEEMIGNPQAFQMLHPEAVHRERAVQAWLQREHTSHRWEGELTDKDGVAKTVVWSNMSQPFPVVGWASWGVGIDMTGQRQAESRRQVAQQALLESESTYRSLFDNMLNGFAHCQMLFEQGEPVDFIYLKVNDAFGKLTGLLNVIGRKVSEVIPGIRQKDPSLFEIYGRVAMTGQPERFETFIEALQMWFSISVYSPQREYFVAVFDVITERKQAEAAVLKEKDVQLALARLGKDFLSARGAFVEEIAQGVLATSLTVTGSRSGFVEALDPITGLSVHRTVAGAFLPTDPCLSVPVISGNCTVAQIAVANGVQGCYTQDDRATMERIADLFAIVLERVKLERQLRHAGRLEAVGTLAGGIAHDFNNILAIIIGNLELVTFGVNELDEVIKNISDAANRGRDLVRQLLTFSRQTGGEKQRLNPVPLVKEVLKLMRSTLPSSIEIREDIRNEEMQISADSTMLYQIIVNLCTNAGQAIGEAGGTITVGVEQVQLEEDAAERLQIAPGRHVMIAVKDTGPGISPDVLERIFEPFFTTKSVGQGTGLGLAVVHGAVQGCGGRVHVESSPGEGATFRVYIPVLETRDSHDMIETNHTSLVRGKGSILFVDDEVGLVQIGTEFLTAMGYTMVGSTDPLEALEKFRQLPDAFDAVITDQTMPGMTGDQLAEKIRAHRPNMPIFLCTGYSDRMTKEKATEAGFARFFIKRIKAFCVACRRKNLVGLNAGGVGNGPGTLIWNFQVVGGANG